MCSDTLDPGGEVRGCSADCPIAMSDVSPFVWVSSQVPYIVSVNKKWLFDVSVVWMRRDSFVL